MGHYMSETRIRVPEGYRGEAEAVLAWLDASPRPPELSSVDTSALRTAMDDGGLTPEAALDLYRAFKARWGTRAGIGGSDLHGDRPDARFAGWLASARRAADRAIEGGAKASGGADGHRPEPYGSGHRPESYGSGHRVAAFGGLTLELRLESRMKLRQVLSLAPSLRAPDGDDYGEVYDRARKLHFTRFGLDAEAAVIGRLDLPEMTHIGSPGIMAFGLPFVVEDFFPNLRQRRREMFITLIGVHEYGERIFQRHPLGAHHMASRLEFAIADRLGVLDDYLEYLSANYFIKFRDVALHRMAPLMVEKLREMGVDVAAPPEPAESELPTAKRLSEDTESARNALAIAEGYEIPQRVLERYEGVDREDMQAMEEKLTEWAQYYTVVEQVKSFYAFTVDAAHDALQGEFGTGRFDPQDPAQVEKFRIAFRLTFFRAMGGLQHDLDEHLRPELIEPELWRGMYGRFQRDLLDAVGGVIDIRDDGELIALEPFLGAGRRALEPFARADYALWEEAGLRLRLVTGEYEDVVEEDGTTITRAEIEAEQAEIEELRAMAWEAAMRGDPKPRSQLARLSKAAEVMRHYGEARGEIDSKMRLLQGRDKYLDRNHLMAVLTYEVRLALNDVVGKHGLPREFHDSLRRRAMAAAHAATAGIGAEAGKFILESPSAVEVEFDVDEIIGIIRSHNRRCDDINGRRLMEIAYLSRRYAAAPDAERQIIEREMAPLLQYLGGWYTVFYGMAAAEKLGILYSAGLMTAPLAWHFIRQEAIGRCRKINELKFLPLLAGDADDAVGRLRDGFVESLLFNAPFSRKAVAELALEDDSFWEELKGHYREGQKGLVAFVRDYGPALPASVVRFAHDIAGSDDALYERLGLRSHLEGVLSQMRAGEWQQPTSKYSGDHVLLRSACGVLDEMERDDGAIAVGTVVRAADGAGISIPEESLRTLRDDVQDVVLGKLAQAVGDRSIDGDGAAILGRFTDLLTYRARRAVAAGYARAIGASVDDVERALPPLDRFRLDIGALAGAYEDFRPLLPSQRFGEFLISVQNMIRLSASRPDPESLRTLMKSSHVWTAVAMRLGDGLPTFREAALIASAMRDTMGFRTFGDTDIAELIARGLAVSLTELKLDEMAVGDIEGLLRDAATAIGHYEKVLDLRPDRIGEDIAEIFGVLIAASAAHLGKTGQPASEIGLLPKAIDLIVIRAMQFGQEFRDYGDVYNYIDAEFEGVFSRVMGLSLQDFERAYRRPYPPDENTYGRVSNGMRLMRYVRNQSWEFGGLTVIPPDELDDYFRRVRRWKRGPGHSGIEVKMNRFLNNLEYMIGRFVDNPYVARTFEFATNFMRNLEAVVEGDRRISLIASENYDARVIVRAARQAWAYLAMVNGDQSTSVDEIEQRMKREFPTLAGMKRGFVIEVERYAGLVEERLAMNRAAAALSLTARPPVQAGGGGGGGSHIGPVGGPCAYHPPMPAMESPFVAPGLLPAMPPASMSMMASSLSAMRMPFGKII